MGLLGFVGLLFPQAFGKVVNFRRSHQFFVIVHAVELAAGLFLESLLSAFRFETLLVSVPKWLGVGPKLLAIRLVAPSDIRPPGVPDD